MKYTFEINNTTLDVEYPDDDDVTQAVTYEVLTSVSYPAMRWMKNVNSIVDVGANVGAFSARMHAIFPDASIVAYEPNPTILPYLRKNIGRFAKVIPAAVCKYAGKVDLALSKYSVMASTSLMPDRPLNRSIKVDAVSLAELPLNIDMLKIDTEGNELEIIRSLGRARWQEIPYIYVEFHNSDARIILDQMLLVTHDLCWARILAMNLGEVLYAKR